MRSRTFNLRLSCLASSSTSSCCVLLSATDGGSVNTYTDCSAQEQGRTRCHVISASMLKRHGPTPRLYAARGARASLARRNFTTRHRGLLPMGSFTLTCDEVGWSWRITGGGDVIVALFVTGDSWLRGAPYGHLHREPPPRPPGSQPVSSRPSLQSCRQRGRVPRFFRRARNEAYTKSVFVGE